jgi:hypothetical protein
VDQAVRGEGSLGAGEGQHGHDRSRFCFCWIAGRAKDDSS